MSKTIRMADGDFLINSAGRSESIEGANKCAQDVAEILLTPKDVTRDYGSELGDLNIPGPIQVFAGRPLISKKVDEAIQRLKRMQELDPYVTDDEAIDRVNRLIVNQIASTDYVFWVSLVVKDGSVVGDQLLGVSLRHQESAKFADTVTQQIRDILEGGVSK